MDQALTQIELILILVIIIMKESQLGPVKMKEWAFLIGELFLKLLILSGQQQDLEEIL